MRARFVRGARQARGQRVDGPGLAPWSTSERSHGAVEMLGHAGFDVVVVDMEHAACGDAIAVADVRG